MLPVPECFNDFYTVIPREGKPCVISCFHCKSDSHISTSEVCPEYLRQKQIKADRFLKNSTRFKAAENKKPTYKNNFISQAYVDLSPLKLLKSRKGGKFIKATIHPHFEAPSRERIKNLVGRNIILAWSVPRVELKRPPQISPSSLQLKIQANLVALICPSKKTIRTEGICQEKPSMT